MMHIDDSGGARNLFPGGLSPLLAPSLYMRTIWIYLHPSLYLFLEQFENLFPNIYTIAVHTGEDTECEILILIRRERDSLITQ